MNREPGFDQTLRKWLDDGADQAPDRFVWAALEDVAQTNQRGAWLALLEGTIMKLKPAAPILGVAGAVLLALAAFQFLGGNVGSRSEPTPTPRAFTSADLANIVFTEANAPEGFTVHDVITGYEALTTPLRPGGPIISQEGFVEAHMTNLNSTLTGGYVTWSALYETDAQAEAAFDYLVNEHESSTSDGWGMDRLTNATSLGDESASFEGAAYDLFSTARTHVWRVNNLILAAVAVGDVAVGDEEASRLLDVAREMDDRAH